MNNVNMHIFKRQTVTFILNMSSVFILSIYPIPINKLVNVNACMMKRNDAGGAAGC